MAAQVGRLVWRRITDLWLGVSRRAARVTENTSLYYSTSDGQTVNWRPGARPPGRFWQASA